MNAFASYLGTTDLQGDALLLHLVLLSMRDHDSIHPVLSPACSGVEGFPNRCYLNWDLKRLKAAWDELVKKELVVWYKDEHSQGWDITDYDRFAERVLVTDRQLYWRNAKRKQRAKDAQTATQPEAI